MLFAAAGILGFGAIGCGGSSSSGLGNKITTLAGTGESGAVDGGPGVARFHNPVNVAIDDAGFIYVADFDNDLIRKIDRSGNVSTLVDDPDFSRPFGLVLGPGNILYAQTDANDVGERNGTTGTVWSIDRTTGAKTVVARNIGRPRGLALLQSGDLIISDVAHHVVSRLSVSTGAVTLIAGRADTPGFVDGNGTEARFDRPYGVSVNKSTGVIYVADQNNNRIRRITPPGIVDTFAGSGVAGSADGPLLSATFNGPQDVKLAKDGTLFVADTTGHKIRAISTNGNAGTLVTTFAGTGVRGFKDGARFEAEFWGLEGIAVSRSNEVVIADGTGGDDDDPPYNRVRVVQ